MKKIALISVHNDPNYGSALQAYALAYAIKREGFDCEYIDYSPTVEQRDLLHKLINAVKKVLFRLGIAKRKKTEYSYWQTPEFRHQRQLFLEFHDRLIPFSSKHYNPTNISESNAEYDCFIIGSDQTWSPYVSKSKYTINFLDFVEPGRIKASYAPSLGTCHLPEEYLETLKAKIGNFDYLSCREKRNAEFLSKRFDRHVEYVLDPTLLLSQEEWLSIAESVDMPDHYILCYILGTKQCISDFAETMGNEKSLPVFFIVSRPEYLQKDNVLKDITPGQFITLISKADYVITDSFHGTLFSVNFKRQFYSFTKRELTAGVNDNDRIGDFLEVLELSEHLKNDNDYTQIATIDYTRCKCVLEKLTSSSEAYLTKVLSSWNERSK